MLILCKIGKYFKLNEFKINSTILSNYLIKDLGVNLLDKFKLEDGIGIRNF